LAERARAEPRHRQAADLLRAHALAGMNEQSAPSPCSTRSSPSRKPRISSAPGRHSSG
jgi:hypothetical protein